MTKSVASAAIAAFLLLAAAPARAETAATWFALDPAPAASEGDAPLDVPFYSRGARYQGVAKLSEAFVLKPGSDDDAALPAGTPLYLVHGKSNDYYCSPKSPRLPNAAELAGSTLKIALGFGLFGGPAWARAASPQCFRDADKDGRFDEVAFGFASFPPFAHNAQINEPIAMAAPVQYETLDPAALPPPLTLTFTATTALLGNYVVRTCLDVAAGDFSTADQVCFPSESVTLGRLPKTIDVLDGQITISSIAPDAAGVVRLRYAVTKAPTAVAILVVSSGTVPAGVERRLYFKRPAK